MQYKKVMFGIEQDRLVENLEKVRLQRCAYSPSSRCDCKYGKAGEEPQLMSEKFSGCPEIMMAIELIKAMKYKEFHKICKRANIV